MDFQFFIVVLGLALFEIISSIDNAVINAHVLKTMPERFRRIFFSLGYLLRRFCRSGSSALYYCLAGQSRFILESGFCLCLQQRSGSSGVG